MLTKWIVGFVIGALLGLSAQWSLLRQFAPEWSSVAMILAAIWTTERFLPQCKTATHGATFVFAVIWGLVHHAPAFPAGSQFAFVTKRSPGVGRTGPAIVESKAGFYALITQDTSHDELHVRTWDAAGPFQSRFGWAQQGPAVCGRHALVSAFYLCQWREGLSQTESLHPLTRALILGDKSQLSAEVKEAFLATGTFHLLVVSGLHVTMIGGAGLGVFAVIVRLLYALRLLNGHAFIVSRWTGFVSVAALLYLYLHIIGMGSSAQRAFLFFAVAFPRSNLGLWNRLRWAMALQTFLFPLGWLGSSTLMSWAAYLLVVSLERKHLVRNTLFVQFWLTCLGAAVFCNFAGPGLLLNPLLAVLFPAITLGAGLDVFMDLVPIDNLLSVFLDLMTYIGNFAISNPDVTLYWSDVKTPWRFALFLIATPPCLNALAKLSIRSEVRTGRKLDVTDTMAGPKRIDR